MKCPKCGSDNADGNLFCNKCGTKLAGKNEFSAFKVMSNYTYEIKDFKSSILGEAALATFTLNYKATMRNQQFDVTSRVTAVLTKKDSGWKVIHEHLSRFPTENSPAQQQYGRRRFPF